MTCNDFLSVMNRCSDASLWPSKAEIVAMVVHIEDCDSCRTALRADQQKNYEKHGHCHPTSATRAYVDQCFEDPEAQ